MYKTKIIYLSGKEELVSASSFKDIKRELKARKLKDANNRELGTPLIVEIIHVYEEEIKKSIFVENII